MLIQPPAQSATQVATFASSMSATGVEQPLVRAPIAPVTESSADASTQNQLQNFQLPERSSAATRAEAEDKSPASEDSASASRSSEQDAARAEADRQKQQMEADQVVIDQLKARDREVRVHEAAHAAAGGQYAGSPSLEYTRGPDGKNYATGGEVSISTSAVSGDPQATIEKARVIRAAALAPAEPSAQDRRVAAEAIQMQTQALSDLQRLKAEEKAAEEQARAEKLKEDEQAETAADTTAEEEAPARNSPPVEKPVVQVAAAATTVNDSSADETEDTAGSEESRSSEPRPDARQQLEKILLGSAGLLEQANRQGLIDPQNPFGKSGYLDVIA